MAIGLFGRERPLTEEALMEELMMPALRKDENDRRYLSCDGQEQEITDKFDENGVCYLTVIRNGEE